ncbi:MAG TPA: barstar family protein [Pseudoduganella sp.]|jgi:RNAse (barnase) inhibitor barstar
MRKPSVVLDLTGVASISQLHQLLSEALEFPGWYGKNWDAFWDAITGLVEMPAQLHFVGWDVLEAQLPSDAQALKNCLDEMHTQFPTIAARVQYS